MTSMQEEIESIGKTAPGYGGIGLGIETEDYRCFSSVPRQELVRSTFYPDPRQSLVRRSTPNTVTRFAPVQKNEQKEECADLIK
ncbi:hypothetical protein GQ600_6864 [Phytophthora cactorum]|nr:hypothetical protein GQ600_6864 [Phytophthora cactorum]